MEEHETYEALRGLGGAIRATLQDGFTARVRYTPGNMTAYDLTFTPFGDATVVSGPLTETPAHEPDMVLVSWVDTSAYPFRLLNRESGGLPNAHYIGEKMKMLTDDGAPREDAHALHLLFAAIIGEEPWSTLREAGIA